jgi:hypothetical protein
MHGRDRSFLTIQPAPLEFINRISPRPQSIGRALVFELWPLAFRHEHRTFLIYFFFSLILSLIESDYLIWLVIFRIILLIFYHLFTLSNQLVHK